MGYQERDEQARALNKFHDKHSYQKPPDWLSEEAKGGGEAEEPIIKAHCHPLGQHAVESISREPSCSMSPAYV